MTTKMKSGATNTYTNMQTDARPLWGLVGTEVILISVGFCIGMRERKSK
jgi:hypothetical protein